MKCSKCGYEIQKYEHYIVTKDERVLDEQCFFEEAVEQLGAAMKQAGIDDEEE